MKTQQILLSGFISFLIAAACAGAAQSQKLEITRDSCENLNRTGASVPADYQPGVDVRGRPVAGADAGGGAALQLPDEITVPVSVDLAERFNMGPDTAARAGVFTVTVTVKNGRLRFNGEPPGAEAETAVRRACLDAYGG